MTSPFGSSQSNFGVVAFTGGMEEGGMTMRPRIDQSLVDQVKDVDGVAEAEGSIGGFTQVIDKEGEPYGDPNFGAPTFGTSAITMRKAPPKFIAVVPEYQRSAA